MKARTRLRRTLLALVAAGLVASCGHRMSRDDLVEANGGKPAEGTHVAVGASGADGASATPTTTPPVATGAQTAPTSAPAAGVQPAPGATAPAAAAGGPCRTKETTPLLIGSVGNYSGPAGSSLLPTAKTLQVWAQWVNQRGGVCGRRVQIAVVDDRSDPAQFRAALQDLVENRHAVAFINAASLTGASGIDYLNKVKVPAIGGGCGVEAEFASPMHFLECSQPANQYYGAAKDAASFGPASKKFALITCREVEACGGAARRELVERQGAKKAGVNMVYETQASITQPDYTAECRGAMAAGAEVVSLMLDAASVVRFGQSCARQGFNPVYTQISATVSNDAKDKTGLGELLVALPTFAFSANRTPAQQEFQRAMAALSGNAPGPAESLGWASAKLFELAATKAATASGSITPATLVAALGTLKNETLGGLIVPVTFPPGKPGIYPSCWFGTKASGGRWSLLADGAPICR